MNMFKKNKKKNDKAAPQQNIKDPSLAMANMIKEADQGILILSKKGHVDVIGVKNTNFASEAKGLIRAALDVYLAREVVNLIVPDLKHLQAQVNQVAKLFGPQQVEVTSKPVVKETKSSEPNAKEQEPNGPQAPVEETK